MINYEELKTIIRDELTKSAKFGAGLKPKAAALSSGEKSFSLREEKEQERQRKNQAILVRFQRDQGLPQSFLRKQNRRLGMKVGGTAEHTSATPVSQVVLTEPRYNLIPEPKNKSALEHWLKTTTARLAVWRAGTRPLTKVALDFIADHAIAKHAVYHEFDSAKVKSLNLFEVKSQIKDKSEFLLRPDLGRQLNPASAAAIQAQCIKNPDIQIIVSDGLSGTALDVNINDLLPTLSKTLQGKGYSLGTPIYCNFGRVILQDRIGELTGAKVCIILIGERPGLGTGDGLSAYLIYKPNSDSTHANRNCISNIHPRGLQFEPAAKYIEFVVTKMMEQQTSGVSLELN